MTDAHVLINSTGSNGCATASVRIFTQDQASEAVIRQSLSALGVENPHFTIGNAETAIGILANEKSPQLLIVDLGTIGDPLDKVRDLAEVCDPGVSVVAIGDRNDIVLYRDLKALGVTEYLLKPLVRSSFSRTCRAILLPDGDRTNPPAGKLLFVVGVRGGVGATTIATNLSWYMAETKRRDTMFVDLDLQKGDAALQLDVTPNHALREALDHPERVDKFFLERAIKHVTEHLDILASLEPLSSTIEFTEEAALWLLDKLLPRYALTLVSVPPAVASRMIWAFRLPSACILVSNLTLSGARDLARWSEIIGANTSERNLLYVLNQTAPHSGLSQTDFARSSGKVPSVVIPYDREFAEASALGIKAMQKCPAFRHSLEPLFRRLAGEPEEKTRTVLSRIFG
ncbi:MAG: response regulator receiver protein [Rhodomicrobium sp.]